MKWHRHIGSAVVLVGLGLGACGNDDPSPADARPVEFPAEPGSIVLASVEVGASSADLPTPETLDIVVTGDGRVVMRPPAGAERTGQLVPDVWTQTITPAGIETLLRAARTAGLFTDREHAASSQDTALPTSSLRLVTSDGSWEHEADALGRPDDDTEGDADRRNLSEFLQRLDDVGAIVGAEALGAVDYFVPDEYLYRAVPVDDSGSNTVIEWPARVTTRLADATICTRSPEIEVGELFETAAATTVFLDDGVTYRVVVEAAWPGADC